MLDSETIRCEIWLHSSGTKNRMATRHGVESDPADDLLGYAAQTSHGIIGHVHGRARQTCVRSRALDHGHVKGSVLLGSGRVGLASPLNDYEAFSRLTPRLYGLGIMWGSIALWWFFRTAALGIYFIF